MIDNKSKQNDINPPSDNIKKVLRPAIIKSAVALVLFIAVITVYIMLPDEFKNSDSGSTSEETNIVLLDGEVAVGTTSIYVFKPLSSSDLKTIEVENTNCSYKLTKSEEGGFYLNDNKRISYSDEAFATLIVATCNTITNERVYPDLQTGEGPSIINYSSFGLSEDTMSGKYTLTTANDEVYTVRVGNLVPSGTGYYACLEGREAVYILDTDLQDTVLGTVESIVNPNLGIQEYDDTSDSSETATSGSINHVSFWRNGNHVTTIHSVSANDTVYINDMYNFAMACKQDISVEELLNCKNLSELENIIGTSAIPYAYVPDDVSYNEVATLLPNLTGEETVALKDAETGYITEEQLAKFGINKDTPAHEIFYSYTGTDGSLSFNHLIFSEKTDGYYYVYSNLNSVIAKISADSIYFLDWDYDQWVEPAFFREYITSLNEIKIKSDKVDYTFKLDHTVNEEGVATLVVSESGNVLDTQNFRNFYRVILSRRLRGAYEGDIPDEDKLRLTLTVTDTDGEVTEYKFYRASTQQMYITINGKGEFYCLSSGIRKLENDAVKVVNGEEVLFEDWN